ncbi:tetratricopeptide repeat protein [Polyangium sp. 15x6]|uniref:tetratricopeptide repeat protein n=1 Tax=Polyangium sp. 15x6 TaxID=3042687 RepID=UPI00249BE8AB|nr:tetratricopeptide repeat protein [Polyangium sp. 15x6]MDI3283845.1 tetratricopeptide repeat protein [Polyangium sp. 15x6]
MNHLRLANAVLLAVLVVGLPARADEPPAPAPTAERPIIPYTSYTSRRSKEMFFLRSRESLMKAQALEKEGRIEEALEAYDNALHQQPLIDVQVEVALAQARAGNYLPAARRLQEVLATGHASGLTVHTSEELWTYLNAIKPFIGTIAIRVNVPDTRITIDGEEVAEWPYLNEFYVEPGKHHIKATKLGFWMNQTAVEVGKGERKDLSIAMQERVHSQIIGFERPVNFSINANLSTSSKNDHPTWPRNLMVASGIGMGLGVGALVTGLIMNSNATSDASATLGQGIAYAGGGLTGLSLAGLIIGAAGIASRPTPTPNVIITPQIAKDGGGVQLAGSIE